MGGWSAIQSIAIRIGEDIFEAKTSLVGESSWRYYINDPSLLSPYSPNDLAPTDNIGGWPLDVSSSNLRLSHPSHMGQIKLQRYFHSVHGFSILV